MTMPKDDMDMDQVMKHTKETTDIQVVEKGIEDGSNTDGETQSIQLEVDPKALLRKMDLRFIPWLSFLYFLSFLDRTSIGNAKLYGLEGDIHITDRQYLTALTIFFISYWAFEVPSNIFLKKLRPSIWIPISMIIWGIIMTAQGLVRNYSGILGIYFPFTFLEGSILTKQAVRFLLGMFEAGLFPGVAYFFSCWYKRSEFGFRTAIFSSMATVSGAFGGLLAAAISNMKGVGGKPGWAWIFILEGLATVVAGVVSFWMVVDFPDTTVFITEAERRHIVKKMRDDGQFSAEGEPFTVKHVLVAFRDYKTWLFSAINVLLLAMAQKLIYLFEVLVAAGYDGPLYAVSLFTPTIINEVSTIHINSSLKNNNNEPGFEATPANLLSVPIYVFAAIQTCLVGYYADKLGRRGFFNLGCFALGIIGYIILITSHNATLSYIAIYLATSGIYPAIANSTTWFGTNTEGSYKRGVTMAMAIGLGNLQGVVSSNVYLAKDAPRYTIGHAVQLGYMSLGFISTLLLMIILHKENKKRERGERDELILSEEQKLNPEKEARNKRNGVFETVEDARRKKGDKWSGFRYQV